MQNIIYQKFIEIVNANENSIAIIEKGRKITYKELSNMVDMIADSFPNNTRAIGLVMAHRIEMIAVMFAALKTGAYYVPAEPNFPIERIHYMMKETNVDFVITEKIYASKIAGFKLLYSDCTMCEIHPDSKGRIYKQSEDNVAYVLYTSGTTGNPKGVQATNKNICHYARAFADEFHIKNGDIMLQYSVCSFDIFTEEVYAPLLNGATIAIPSDDDKKDIYSLMKFVDNMGVTIISGFPYLIAQMNHLDNIPSSLRLLISGGDVLRGHYVDNLINKISVYNTYGPSETTVCAAYYDCSNGYVLDDGTYPLGHAVKGIDIKIMDENGNECHKGKVGELYIYGDGVSNGYIGDRKEENKVFVTLNDGTKLYKSGDLGYILKDGNIAFLHRKDTQIMIYGKRVEIMEVESKLYQCKGVEQALVRSFLDEEGLNYMIAYIVTSDKNLKLSMLKEELSKSLTSFMIPEFIIKVKEIPLNLNGKPDIAKLPVVMKDGRL